MTPVSDWLHALQDLLQKLLCLDTSYDVSCSRRVGRMNSMLDTSWRKLKTNLLMTCLRPDFSGRRRMKVLLNLITASRGARRDESRVADIWILGWWKWRLWKCKKEKTCKVICHRRLLVTHLRSNLDKLAKPERCKVQLLGRKTSFSISSSFSPLALFHNGSPLGSPGPLGDLFGDLGPLFMFWVPFFSILD